MKSLQMNARVSVEYDKKTVRQGPEFLCSECDTWFKKLVYWTSKKFNPDQEYKMIFLYEGGYPEWQGKGYPIESHE